MRLPQLLKETDSISHSLSHEELENILHEIARIWPEGQRDH